MPASIWPWWIDWMAPRVVSITWAVVNMVKRRHGGGQVGQVHLERRQAVIDGEDQDQHRDAADDVAVGADEQRSGSGP